MKDTNVYQPDSLQVQINLFIFAKLASSYLIIHVKCYYRNFFESHFLQRVNSSIFDLEVRILNHYCQMFFYHFPNSVLAIPKSDISLGFYANFSHIRYVLVCSLYDGVGSLLYILLSVDRKYYFSNRIDSSYFEVIAWLF